MPPALADKVDPSSVVAPLVVNVAVAPLAVQDAKEPILKLPLTDDAPVVT